MKVYVVTIDGVEVGLTKAKDHNTAEQRMQKKFPGKMVMVAYTEIGPEEEKTANFIR